jgi:hypothetical protein
VQATAVHLARRARGHQQHKNTVACGPWTVLLAAAVLLVLVPVPCCCGLMARVWDSSQWNWERGVLPVLPVSVIFVLSMQVRHHSPPPANFPLPAFPVSAPCHSATQPLSWNDLGPHRAAVRRGRRIDGVAPGCRWRSASREAASAHSRGLHPRSLQAGDCANTRASAAAWIAPWPMPRPVDARAPHAAGRHQRGKDAPLESLAVSVPCVAVDERLGCLCGQVSVHVSAHDRMDFITKNFKYHTLPFDELIRRAAYGWTGEASASGDTSVGGRACGDGQGTGDEPKAAASSEQEQPTCHAAPARKARMQEVQGGARGEEEQQAQARSAAEETEGERGGGKEGGEETRTHGRGECGKGGSEQGGEQQGNVSRTKWFIAPHEKYYLRALGADPRKSVANIAHDFPDLANEVHLPNLCDDHQVFSSVLRVGSPGIHLWTHYDVMDNALVQVLSRLSLPPSLPPSLPSSLPLSLSPNERFTARMYVCAIDSRLVCVCARTHACVYVCVCGRGVQPCAMHPLLVSPKSLPLSLSPFLPPSVADCNRCATGVWAEAGGAISARGCGPHVYGGRQVSGDCSPRLSVPLCRAQDFGCTSSSSLALNETSSIHPSTHTIPISDCAGGGYRLSRLSSISALSTCSTL